MDRILGHKIGQVSIILFFYVFMCCIFAYKYMGLYCNLDDCTAVVSLQKPQNDNIGGSNTLNFIHSNLFNAAAAVICTDCTVVTERLVNK